MKLHTVFISYDRLHLTKRAISSYLDTVTVPFTYVVVDNGSDKEARDWLWDMNFRGKMDVLFLIKNKYPGYACNRGWESAPPDATHLQRADNDFIFRQGWCDEVERMFRNRRLGQLGLRTDEEELFVKSNVGGNNIIRRQLWDKGLRYDERPWPEINGSEDTLFSPAVKKLGWQWGRVEKPCIINIDEKDSGDPYYVRSFADRGIDIKLWMSSQTSTS